MTLFLKSIYLDMHASSVLTKVFKGFLLITLHSGGILCSTPPDCMVFLLNLRVELVFLVTVPNVSGKNEKIPDLDRWVNLYEFARMHRSIQTGLFSRR